MQTRKRSRRVGGGSAVLDNGFPGFLADGLDDLDVQARNRSAGPTGPRRRTAAGGTHREGLLAEHAFFDFAHALDDPPIQSQCGSREAAAAASAAAPA